MHEGSFLNSVRALRVGDAAVVQVMAVLGVFVLATLASWFFLAKVVLYEPSVQAQLEVGGAARPVVAAVEGQVLSVNLQLGREVRAGELLVELDSTALRLQGAEAQAQLSAVEARCEGLHAEIDAAQQSAQGEARMSQLASDMARVENKRADLLVELAEVEAQRTTQLQSSGFASEAEQHRSLLEVQQLRASAEARRLARAGAEMAVHTQASTRQQALLRLKRELAELEGERGSLKATLQRLEYRVSQYQVRARFDGTLGEVASLRAGETVHTGVVLASIIPLAPVRVLAQFAPQAALGRVRVGQRAQVYLDGFPQTQYGGMVATVSAVASQARDGQVRVELNITEEGNSGLPLQHGLPCTAVVEVESTSPMLALLRAAGILLDGPRPGPVRATLGMAQ